MKYQHLVSRLLVCMFSTVLSQASNSALAQDSSTKPDLSGVGRPILYSEPLEPLPNVKPASANGFFWHILHSLGLAKDIKTFTWMVNRVELIKLDSIQSDTQNDKRSYYLLAVPANLPTGNQNVHYLSFDLAIGTQEDSVRVPQDADDEKTIKAAALADSADLQIESVYPTHSYVAEQFQHSNELDVTVSPQVMGFSAVTIGDKFVAQNTEIAQMPTITGTFEQERLTGSWDFRKQGNQQISLGGATLFVIFSYPKTLDSPLLYRAYLYNSLNAPPVATGSPIFLTDANGKVTSNIAPNEKISVSNKNLPTYLKLHQGELPADSVKFLSGLLSSSKPGTPGAGSYKVTVEPVNSAPSASVSLPGAIGGGGGGK